MVDLLPGTGVLAAILLCSAGAAAEESSEKGSEKAPAKVEEKVRGPAEALVVEAGAGYSGGLFTAIKGHDPRAAHGAAFHLGVGWAWTVGPTQSLGAQIFADGAFDSEAIVGPNSTGKIAPRFGVAAALWGDVAHLRVGGAWTRSRYEGGTYSGPSAVFAAGWHVALMPSLKTWKRPVFTFEFVPSFDFLKAPGETLNRWTLAALVGFAAY